MSAETKPPMTALPRALPLALTMGEPAGIGPDITLSAWLMRKTRQLPPFVVLGRADIIRARATLLGLAVPIETVTTAGEALTVFDRALPVLDLEPAAANETPPPVSVSPGKPDPAAAPLTVGAIRRAVELVQLGEASAVVTNPIAKSVLYAAGFRHPGHTEYLAELARAPGGGIPRPVMMIASDALRVVPLTIHVPLAQVSSLLTRELIVETVRITHAALMLDFGIERPRIAVAGLNPHAGENGTIGDEEVQFISPAISALRTEGLIVSGPHSADTLFHAAARTHYDAAIGMYHDQVLVPAKTLAFDTGVNVTLGLPFVRTSPDHGTAFDIAGKGIASSESLIAALLMAADMATNRAKAGAAE